MAENKIAVEYIDNTSLLTYAVNLARDNSSPVATFVNSATVTDTPNNASMGCGLIFVRYNARFILFFPNLLDSIYYNKYDNDTKWSGWKRISLQDA